MKYIKTYETKVTQKSLTDTIYSFLLNALPDKFNAILYNATINIKDNSITKKNKARNDGYYYTLKDKYGIFSIYLCSSTADGSDINLVSQFIIEKITSSNIPLYSIGTKEKLGAIYDEETLIEFNIKYFEDVIEFFNQLSKEELEIFITSKKYNL